MIDIAKANVGSLDRLARIVVGLAVLALSLVGPRSAWGLLGLVPLVTGLAGTCPLYTLSGVSTCPRPASRG